MARRRYVLAYDIRNDRRLRQVHELVLGFGEMLQYSVYVCDLADTEKVQLVSELDEIMDHRRDSVVFIDLGLADRRGSECFEFYGARTSLPTVNKARIL